MADTIDFAKEFEDTERKTAELISKALDKRKLSDTLEAQIKRLEAQKAEADKQAATAEKSIDTHYKCLFAGVVMAALRKGTLSKEAVTGIVDVIDHANIKLKDRKALKERYKGLEGLSDIGVTLVKKDSPAPVKCKCGATMIQKTTTQGENAGKHYLSCPSSTPETKAQHDFKWIEGGAA